MKSIAIAEIVSASLIIIILIGQIAITNKSVSMRRYRILSWAAVVWLISDIALYYCNKADTSYAVRYVVNLLPYLLSSLIIALMYFYCASYLNETVKINRLVFNIPLILLPPTLIANIIAFATGRIVDVESGSFAIIATIPVFSIVCDIIMLLYPACIAFVNRKTLGYKSFLILTFFCTPYAVSVIVMAKTGYDCSVLAGAFSAIIVTIFLQSEKIKAHDRSADEQKAREELINRMRGDESVFLIDFMNDSRKTVHDSSFGAMFYSDDERYSDAFSRYVNTFVAEPDREKMIKNASPEYIAEQLKERKEYMIRYRDTTTGLQRFYEMKIVRFSDTEAIQSFKEKDKEIIEELMLKKLQEEYFALFAVDIDTGMVKVIKQSPWYKHGEEGEVIPYKEMVDAFSRMVGDNANGFFERIGNVDYLKQRFIGNDKATYTYKSLWKNSEKWVSVTVLVLSRHESGLPSLLSLGLSMLDEEATEKEELQLKIRESLNVVGGLANEYTAIYHVNLDTGEYVAYYLDEKEEGIKEYYESCPTFSELTNAYACSELINPEHKARLFNLFESKESVRSYLEGRKSISIMFQRNTGQEYRWTEADIIKTEAAEEDAHAVIVGLIDKNENVLREQEDMKNRHAAEEAEKIIDGFVSAYNVACTVNMTDDSTKLLSMEKFDLLKEMTAFEKFSEVKAFLLENIIHPTDKEKVEEELSFENIRRRLKKEKSYSFEYRALLRGAIKWNTIVIQEIGTDSIIIGFLWNNCELIKKHLESKRFEEYIALFTIDFDTEYIQVVKCSDSFIDIEEKEILPYNDAIKIFLNTYEGSNSEAFLRDSADIEKVKNEFAHDDKRTFSYKSVKLGGDKWIDVICDVIDRHEDGTPAMIAVGFSLVDTLASLRQELQMQIKENMEIIGGLANEYHALYYYNISEGWFKVVSLDKDKFPEVEAIINRNISPEQMFHLFGQSPLVHPDDRHVFENLTLDSVKEILAHKRRFVSRFRRRFNDRYLWTEIEIVKYENVDEAANAIAVGFAERDAEVRSEQALHSSFNVLNMEISHQDAIKELMKIIGEYYGADRCCIFECLDEEDDFENSYEWCKSGITPIMDKFPRFSAMRAKNNFLDENENGAYYGVAGEEGDGTHGDIEEMMEEFGTKALIMSPIMNGDKVSGMITVENPTLAQENNELLKNISSVVLSEVLKDRTEKLEEDRRKAKELQDAFDAADAANKLKTNFLFNMSHDIRTPMNAITGFTSMAKKYVKDTDRVIDYLDKIDSSGQQLLSLINQVLEMARIESGKLEIEEKPVIVKEEFDALVTVLSEQAKTNGLEFRHSYKNIVHERVFADRARLSSITFNIVGNSMKYTPEGGCIEFVLEEIPARKPDCASYVFTVTDNGIGMTEEYQKIIFDPFTREKSSTVSKIQGTGLGMAIVKNLVDLLGGSIEVHSEVGKGTRFDTVVDLKLNHEEPGETEEKLIADMGIAAGHRVLLVEDNDLNREITSDILLEHGLKVENAEDGSRAVEMVKRKGPDYFDAILMDIQMPIMNGYEATKVIRELYPDNHIPIIALSANAFKEDKSASLAAGMDNHVAKPIDPAELFGALAEFF